MNAPIVFTLGVISRQDIYIDVTLATRFQDRCRGLIGRPPLSRRAGLLLWPGGSIHTLGMRYAIDVLFLDRDFRILKREDQLAPYRFSAAPRHTQGTLELRAGAPQALSPGVQLHPL